MPTDHPLSAHGRIDALKADYEAVLEAWCNSMPLVLRLVAGLVAGGKKDQQYFDDLVAITDLAERMSNVEQHEIVGVRDLGDGRRAYALGPKAS